MIIYVIEMHLYIFEYLSNEIYNTASPRRHLKRSF